MRKKAVKLVIIESPYAGDVERNVAYAKACMRDSIKRGEAPFASHLLYTQDGILNDNDPAERKLGMECGFFFANKADLVAVYTDYGITDGMKAGIALAEQRGRPVEYRSLKEGVK